MYGRVGKRSVLGISEFLGIDKLNSYFFIMKNNYCYFNGQLIPFSEARLQLNDLGLIRTYGIFDYLRTYDGSPFQLKAHLDRLENSAAFLHLDLSKSQEEITGIIDELLYLRENKKQEVGIRVVLTGGYSSDGGTFEGCPNLFITCEDLVPIPESYYKEGIKVISYPYQRHLPEIKTTNYLPIYLLQKEKEFHQAQDVLYYNQNKISECSRANFFIFQGKQLLTTKEDILKGITRQVVLDLAQEFFEVHETDIFLKDLEKADEAFKTGSAGEITPIVQVDDMIIGQGRVGENTQKLMQAFQDYTHTRLEEKANLA